MPEEKKINSLLEEKKKRAAAGKAKKGTNDGAENSENGQTIRLVVRERRPVQRIVRVVRLVGGNCNHIDQEGVPFQSKK